ncbi:PEP/pyruvate-binding domain-containing protein [Haloferula sp. A504]|uniref:PEP/pyruvate-binding domain-containing protein n=1 Tax=Haloferula sp. A504 TaxID=3373601 RepID=UPI0031C98E9F|nr:PEP-utilizing enzyme [Verrucomicrobiaceae bacterium E54]
MKNDFKRLGGKGAALRELERAGFPVPGWVAVLPGEAVSLEDVAALGGTEFAVRSSAQGEDGGEHSFAGQLESFLRVPLEEVTARVEDVRESGAKASVRKYQDERGVTGELETAVIVQRMIEARFAGVAFSANPVDGRRRVTVISAVEGTAERLVSGEVDGEMWCHDGDWREKGTLLDDETVRSIIDLARRCEAFFGRPQDIEWAVDGDGKLWLLQSRAITTLGGLPDPDDELQIWDNSNIAESYGGVTSALTFSFARRIYEHVYREFCRMMKVPGRRMERGDAVFSRMLGMIEGRVYYNLLSWYRVLALLPGFSVNRRFMEQMMGVKESLPGNLTEAIAAETREGKFADGMALARTLLGLVWSQLTLKRRIAEFRERLDEALGEPEVPHARMSGDELVAEYRRLESSLLKRWDAPLVNDFLAMICNGVLRKMCAKRPGGEDLANGLIADCGEIISAEPARRIREMGELASKVDGLAEMLADPGVESWVKRSRLRELPELAEVFDQYVADFGDRCLEELKLESPTLEDDPGSLLASIGAMALRGGASGRDAAPVEVPPGWLFGKVLAATRARVRDRENLRFERTRLFGRVRRIVRELGRRLHADGQLADLADVFHLELEELLGAWEGTRTSVPLGALAAARKAEYFRCLEATAPPDRLATRGPLHRYRSFEAMSRAVKPDGENLQGVGACPGVVRGRVRVVEDPRSARLEAGEILVARQTDPGWVVLFPQAAGLLVERGSVLSHSAIVSRELGLPCVVSLPGVMDWLETGQWVEMDGSSGQVVKVEEDQE